MKVSARGSEPAREATVSIHFTTTTLLPPYRRPASHPQKLPAIDVSVVWVTEVNPPADATPLQWLLITNVEVTDFADAIGFAGTV